MNTNSRMASAVPHKTIVLDDDPTGSQEATGVPVMLRRDRSRMASLLSAHPALFVLTNTRALSEADAVALLRGIRDDIRAVERTLGVTATVVLRGDSTLRGHVFAEVAVFADADPDAVVVFVPAFPAGGRRTVAGVHTVEIGGRVLNAADTEFASDPVFGYRARTLAEFVREKSSRKSVTTSTDDVGAVAATAPPGTVIIPDASTDGEIARIADAVRALVRAGRSPVVRCAAPLAAFLADVKSTAFIDPATIDHGDPVLVVAGSHTSATTAQLADLGRTWPAGVEIDATDAIEAPAATAHATVERLLPLLRAHRVVTVSTSRVRGRQHGRLEDGARVMECLTATVAGVRDVPRLVVAKGGITSAEVARRGMGADWAWVDGQVAPGISLWHLDPDGRNIPYVVVPGNVGAASTLSDLVAQLSNR